MLGVYSESGSVRVISCEPRTTTTETVSPVSFAAIAELMTFEEVTVFPSISTMMSPCCSPAALTASLLISAT